MFISGFLEGIGVALFLPILQNGFGDDKLSQVLKFIFGLLGIGFSFIVVLVFILLFFILRSAFLLVYAKYFGRVSADLVIVLRHKVLDKIFNADYIYLLKKEVGYINNMIIREVSYVINAFDTFSAVLNYTIYGVIYLALAMLINYKAAIIVMLFGPCVLIFTRKLNRLINQNSLVFSLSHGGFHSVLIQALSKLKYLKATLSSMKISKKIDKESKKLGDTQYKLYFLQSLSKNIFEPFVILIVVGLLFYYVTILKKNVSEVVFLAFLFLQIARQFLNAQTSYRKFLAAMGSIETYSKFDKELEENKEDLRLDGKTPDFNKDIIFKNVTVTFPNGKRALNDINMVIKPRSTVAFVGHSGSGKSTIANMVTGILKPTGGEICFGDRKYDELNLKSLRENTGYVTQEDIIFDASIRDNISLWDKKIDEKHLKKVIEMAHINGFVGGLREREGAMLGDNGLNISGGQRQRITIARELYKDTKLLILDEATSSLDSKSEKHIYENLKQFKGTKTMLVIAHRLSTIKNADYIYVLDDGRIVEEGRFEELIRRKGDFKKMIDDQKLIEINEVKI